MTGPHHNLAISDRFRAANEAMESFEAWRRHTAGCQQCRLSPDFCKPRKDYEQGFERDYDRWKRYPREASHG